MRGWGRVDEEMGKSGEGEKWGMVGEVDGER